MKGTLTLAAVHAVAWILMLVIPFATTYQVVTSFLPDQSTIALVPVCVLSICLILIFYLNYFVLIPRFFLTGKYKTYVALYLGCILVAIGLSGIIFHFAAIGPESFENRYPDLRVIKPIMDANVVLLLVISFVISLALALGDRVKQLEVVNFSAEVAMLKSQINPHFLFNTLNNIYATALDTSPTVATMIEKLSDMMRYNMRGHQEVLLDLEEEIKYAGNYIDLQRMRLTSKVKLESLFTGNFSGKKILPMLLIPFIENAFKHGVSAEQKSSITIGIDLTGDLLYLRVINTRVNLQTDTRESSGIGIENTRKRLQLVYPENHTLEIRETDKEFQVFLQINLA